MMVFKLKVSTGILVATLPTVLSTSPGQDQCSIKGTPTPIITETSQSITVAALIDGPSAT
ncbi:hypothetical protein PPTG_22759 [Phytophthora nicotianae INRA-310]|uniref:Pectate lyase n=1 Tax=Phytophthora nicotianae (strain INRA-310) TaxID=761204 RepID=W2QE17_PHYN3|nr:hypothetical protein PPTG_22759 [Phytophthora nicotianae INRA-310]ETN10515.1 hypothetical protein PPTG_22759 [Phytophthora nicotianae INRA-310]